MQTSLVRLIAMSTTDLCASSRYGMYRMGGIVIDL